MSGETRKTPPPVTVAHIEPFVPAAGRWSQRAEHFVVAGGGIAPPLSGL